VPTGSVRECDADDPRAWTVVLLVTGALGLPAGTIRRMVGRRRRELDSTEVELRGQSAAGWFPPLLRLRPIRRLKCTGAIAGGK